LEGKETKLNVFGNHNLLNLYAAWLVCKQLDVSVEDFLKAISTFTGAAKRLELLAKNDNTIVYRDFAHAPSKAKATIDAARQQFPDKKLIAVFELHTYSSLNAAFMKEYEGVMNGVDEAAVFYSKHALELKRMPELDKSVVANGFQKKDLNVFNNRKELEDWLNNRNYNNSVVLFMSSGNYEGINTGEFGKKITGLLPNIG
jgi:UDP-N-acetylmuramate: L-alanyl-gamma-D-glutamyl-meso-diaminopimelate ligase